LSGERGVLRALNLTTGLVGQAAEQKYCNSFASQFVWQGLGAYRVTGLRS